MKMGARSVCRHYWNGEAVTTGTIVLFRRSVTAKAYWSFHLHGTSHCYIRILCKAFIGCIKYRCNSNIATFDFHNRCNDWRLLDGLTWYFCYVCSDDLGWERNLNVRNAAAGRWWYFWALKKFKQLLAKSTLQGRRICKSMDTIASWMKLHSFSDRLSDIGVQLIGTRSSQSLESQT